MDPHRRLSMLNPNPAKLAGPALLHQLVRPPSSRLALEHSSRNNTTVYSYRRLHSEADALANRITAARGQQTPRASEFVVPVLVPQSALLCVSLLAVLKAGGAFCPVAIDAPPERIRFILDDVAAQVLVVSKHLASSIPRETRHQVIYVDDDLHSHVSTAPALHRVPVPDDLAYVMYTSGSTGTPKGVAVSHLAVTQALLAHDRHVPRFNRFLQFAAPTFDVSVFEIFFPLFRGSTIVSVRRQEMLDDLPAVIRRMDVDACELTPTVASSLLRSRNDAPNLKLLLTIGEMLKAPVVGEFGSNLRRESILWAMYGPTEATIHCTVQAAMASDSPTGNIGIPLDSVSCFILEPRQDSAAKPCPFKILPIGQPGELAIGGLQVARGYLNRPEQTAAVFIQSPYGRLYRTGDRARLTQSGTLECLGRLVSGQVKLRGQRIELGEIEHVVLKTPGCHDAVAAVVDSNLVVFCCVSDQVGQEALIATCAKWLPRFMIPAELVLMQVLPRLSSGKVDMKKLLSDFGQQRASALGLENPDTLSNPRHHDMLELVSRILGVRVNDNMTTAAAGVDSLAAIKLASALRRRGIDTTAPHLLRPRTISSLCRTILERPLVEPIHREPLSVAPPPLGNRQALATQCLPCTPLQSAMLAETAKDAEMYCNEIELQVKAGICPGAIRDAILGVAGENQVLRMGFSQWQGIWVAVVFESLDPQAVHVVPRLQRGFTLQASDDFLMPLRVQIESLVNEAGRRVLIQAHHAVFDGWSVDMMLADVSSILSGSMPQPRPQFQSVLEHQHRLVAGDQDKKFWTEYLLGWHKVPFPKLVGCRIENTIETTRETLQLSPQLVRKAVSKLGLSPQVPFQAALALCWSAILGANDVVIGSVTSGRTLPIQDIDRIMGPCIASLPLRIDMRHEASHSLHVLRDIHASNRAVMDHSSLPLLQIKKLAGLQPTESLYDVLFVYQESLLAFEEKKKQLVVQQQHVDRLETRFLVEVEPRDEDYVLQATFHRAHLSPDVVRCFMQQFGHTLQQLLQQLDPLVSAHDTLPNPRLSVYNQDIKPFTGVADLAARFETTAAKLPNEMAFIFNTSPSLSATTCTSLTYRQLNHAANQVAHYLHSQLVAPGQVVAIIMDKSPALYVSILGIVKAGCAYMPLLPTTPMLRIRDILKLAKIAYCLVDNASQPALDLDQQVTTLNVERAPLDSFPDHNRGVAPDASRLAYVIYTSGTTGVPKGVAVTQGNIVSNIAYLQSIYPIAASKQSRFLQACSQAFDVSVFDIFYAWHAGMCLCSATNDVLFSDLEESIRQFEITHLSLTPTVASLIDPAHVPGVEFLVTAGEPMTWSVLERWGDLLWQGYGPSETTNICSVKHMTRSQHVEHLGWVLPNTLAAVVKPKTLEILPMGCVGEFCLGGDQVAQGYLDDPVGTREKFIQHPRLGRVYRSGDMGRMLPDGSLVILGRLDDQLKLRGQRIEAGEISGIVTRTRLVSAAVTMIVRPRAGARHQLAVFYTPREPHAEFTRLQVHRETHAMMAGDLQSRLPLFMVPSYLVPVSLIPRTSSGKIDHGRLQASFAESTQEDLESWSCSRHGQDDHGDWSDAERAIAKVLATWASVEKEEIGRWTPFAALGIDSMSAIDVSRALSSGLHARVPISTIIQNPSIAQLARHVGTSVDHEAHGHLGKKDIFNLGVSEENPRACGHSASSIEDILPCTPLQEAMLAQRSSSYCNRTLLRLSIAADNLMAFWDTVTQRHGILRTFFITTSNTARPMAQVILKEHKTQWEEFNIHEPCFAAVTQQHAGYLPELLDSGRPPLTCAIVRCRGNAFFSLVCHHALYDGVAMGTLWREIETLAKGGALVQPVLPFRNFLERALDLPHDTARFWARHFCDFEARRLFPQRAGAETSHSSHTVCLETPLSDMQARLRSLGAGLLPLCQAAWAQVLGHATEATDVAFGNVVSGRALDVDGLDSLVAPCFNTIPLRMNLTTGQNMRLVQRFQSLNVEVMPYQFTAVRDVARFANCKGRRLFDTVLLLQQPVQELDQEVWTLEHEAGDMGASVVCEVVPCAKLDSLTVKLHHHADTVTGGAAAAMAALFSHVAQRLVHAPLTKLEDGHGLCQQLRRSLSHGTRNKPMDEDATGSEDGAWTGLERSIQSVLASISGVPADGISRRTTIFRLGLDSINAVHVASVLRRQGLTVSASDVIECPDCASLAQRISHPLQHSPSPEFIHLPAFALQVAEQVKAKALHGMHPEAVLPCTPVQSAMLASFLQSQGQNYLNMATYEIQDGYTLHDVCRAWKEMVCQHPMLRTGFVAVHHRYSAFAMVRNPTGPVADAIHIFPQKTSRVLDLTPWKESCRISFVQDLSQPPWKVALSDAGDRVSMSLLCHHALYDARSLQGILHGVHDLLHGKRPSYPAIEPALAEILHQSLANQDAAEAWWKQMSGNAVVNKFPQMTPLRESQNTLQQHHSVSDMTLRSLTAALQGIDVSVQAAAQAAWARVLASYVGESSVVFGVTMSGRTTDATQNTPMPCITTVPVIATADESNADTMRHMMAYNAELHKHQFAPLTKIQQWLGHATSPLFDTLLVYQRGHHLNPSAQRLFKTIAQDARVDYAVSLELEPADNDNIHLTLSFSTDLLPVEQARLLLAQFDATLCFLASQPTARRQDLYTLRPHLFSVLPAAMPVIKAPVALLHQFVEMQANLQPQAAALEFVSGFEQQAAAKQVWSYHELNLLGNRVANLLHRHSRPGDIVAIQFNKQPEAYFAILGILKAGCAFVALDPNAPLKRRQFVLHDSGATCLLLAGPTQADFETTAVIIPIDLQSLQSGPNEQLHRQAVQPTPASTCYCLYTSGTTGTPKGCEITHENAVQAIMAFQDLFKGHWQKDSRWLQFAAFHFDVSVLEQYWSWSVGITVVSAPREAILDNLIGSINRLAITHIDLTPSLARLTHPHQVPTLCRGVFITGGEQLKQEILDSWGSKAVIYNAYGPTEATIGVTMYPRVPVNGRPSNIGKQFLNVGSYVLALGTETPVLRGAVGELCVSGKLVGKGYLNRQELTAERFPVLAHFHERVYRTGDLVRLLHDGCFDFVGRADDQVKLRGQRLEIGEIDDAIRMGACGVADVATVVVRHKSNDGEMLVAFLVGKIKGSQEVAILPDADGLGHEARAACLQRLPGYMVPTYFLRLSRMPLSANNKAELKMLRAMFQALSHDDLIMFSMHGSAAYIASLDERHVEKVCRVVSTFSRVARDAILPSSSIFDLGVDSISALRLATLLKAQGFHTASPALILKSPIVADLVRALAAEPVAPSTSGLQGILSKSMTEEACQAYFHTLELRLNENAAAERARLAWSRVVEKHGILRTSFVNTGEGYIQVARKQASPTWKILTAETDSDVGAIMNKTRQDWMARNRHDVLEPLELVHVCGPRRQTLFLHMFHAIYDGWSLEKMRRYAAALYHGHAPNQGPMFIQALTHGPLWSHQDCRDFWMQHLRDWEPRPMPLVETSCPQAVVSASHRVPMSAFEHLRREQNVTMQSVILASWTRVLQRYLAGKTTIGVVIAGRSIPQLARVQDCIGPMFNTVPFFAPTERQASWASLIRRVYEFSTSLVAFQHVPLQSIQKWCAGGRLLFDTLFVFQREQDIGEEQDDDDEAPWTVVEGPSYPDYPLAFEAVQCGDGHVRLSIVAQGRFATLAMLQDMLAECQGAAEMARGQDVLNDDLHGIIQNGSIQQDSGKEPVVDLGDFSWTDEALLIREQVASLASMQPEKIGASTSMLQLGLDSIDVMKLAARLKEKGLGLSASQLMRCQTILRMTQETRLASRGEEQHDGNLGHALLEKMTPLLWTLPRQAGINVENVESVLPSTALQEAMVAGMLESDFEWYFNHDVLDVSEAVDLDRLRAAWAKVVEQSPILRTGFIPVEDATLDTTYCQVVFRYHQALDIQTVHLDNINQVRQLMTDATKRARRGAGVEQLFQLQLALCGSRKLLVVSLAHALYDGWSIGLVYKHLEAAYRGEPEARPGGEIRNFIAQTLTCAATEEAQGFWSNYLDGMPSTMLSPQSTATDNKCGVLRQESAKVALWRIRQLCRNLSVSLQAVCASCWAMVAAQQTQSLAVVFGLVLAGRDGAGAESLIFPTMNTVALSCVLHGTVADLLGHVEHGLGEVRRFQTFPLRKALRGARRRFNSLFLMQKTMPESKSDERLLHSVDGEAAVDYPVCVEAEADDESGCLAWRVACHGQVLTKDEVDGLVDKLNAVLEHMLVEGQSGQVLDFARDGGVSICGLPAIVVGHGEEEEEEETKKKKKKHVNGGGEQEHGEWARVLRETLAEVAHVPVDGVDMGLTLYHLGLDSISAIKVSMQLRKRGIVVTPRQVAGAPSLKHVVGLLRGEQEETGGGDEVTRWTPPAGIEIDQLVRESRVEKEAVEAVLPATAMQVHMLSTWQNSGGNMFYPEFRIPTNGRREDDVVREWEKVVERVPVLRTRLW
ncbi:hypothetical protein CDD82_4277 [Ophiocordyceps australis]|uniref:Carrier domain-containing protein n=1 Tax=Ophiocordyceps australis TaxID=1399860 RepID=A0A2C5Z9H7_9HYPO|nr:hypothetical protein CDD82_4277 [Ophiocordyceps australis]